MLDEQIDSVITDSIVPEWDSVVFPISLLRESVSWKPFLPFDTLTNQVELVELLRRIKETYPAKNIWCYTGYLYDVDLPEGGKVHTDVTEEMLSYIDVLVDGEFVQEKKDITLKFRGSSNQRVLKLENGKVVEHLFDS